jgi:Tfp pilus assembly protein PilZ
MRLLTVVFGSSDDFLAHYSGSYPNGAIFCATRAAVNLQDQVLLDVSISALEQPVRLRGTVVSLVSVRGLWVHLDARDEAPRDYLLAAARGEAEREVSRSHPRFPSNLRASCRIEEADAPANAIETEIADLGPGGAFVVSDRPPLVGSRVCLTLDPLPGRDEATRIDGRVAWVGRSLGRSGFGVRFDVRGAFGAGPLRSALRRASESGQFLSQ